MITNKKKTNFFTLDFFFMQRIFGTDNVLVLVARQPSFLGKKRFRSLEP